jgi:DNA-binding NarL/FixJ family response regulator
LHYAFTKPSLQRHSTTQKIKGIIEIFVIFILNEFTLLYIVLIRSKKEKEMLVIKLAEEGKSTKQIAETVYISLKDIGIINRRFGNKIGAADHNTPL